MKDNNQKLFIFITAIFMTVFMLPTIVFAQDHVVSNGDLQSKITNATAGDTILIDADITNDNLVLNIDKSLTIKSKGSSKHTLKIKSIYITGNDTTVTLENLKITRTVNAPHDSGAGYYTLLGVGIDASAANDSAPTVYIKNSEISMTGNVGQAGNDDIKTVPLRFDGGNCTVENSTIKNDVKVNKVGAMAVLVDGKTGSHLTTRNLVLENTDLIATDSTQSNGIMFTNTVNDSDVSINGGKIEGVYAIDYAGNKSTLKVTGANIKGWSGLTIRGSSLDANFYSSSIDTENKHTVGANNYAAIVVESGDNNHISVDDKSSISGKGNNTDSSNQRIVAFYTGNNNSVDLKGTIKVGNNKSSDWIVYSKDNPTATPANGNKVQIEESAILDIQSEKFGVIDQSTKEIKNYDTLEQALEAANSGDTIVLGKDVTDAVIISKELTIQTGGHNASGIKAGKGLELKTSGNIITIAKQEPTPSNPTQPEPSNPDVNDNQDDVPNTGVENPQTGDGIITYIVMGTLSLLGLAGITTKRLILNKR